MPVPRNRNQERQHLAEPMRQVLLEQDVDALDEEVSEVRAEVDKTNRILVGLLVSVVTAGVLFVISRAMEFAASGGP